MNPLKEFNNSIVEKSFKRDYGLFLSVAYSRCRCSESAKDIVQDAVVDIVMHNRVRKDVIRTEGVRQLIIHAIHRHASRWIKKESKNRLAYSKEETCEIDFRRLDTYPVINWFVERIKELPPRQKLCIEALMSGYKPKDILEYFNNDFVLEYNNRKRAISNLLKENYKFIDRGHQLKIKGKVFKNKEYSL